MITLVLVDDHPIVLDGLERLFSSQPDFRVVERCVNADEARQAVRRWQPDVLILDLLMPGASGLELLRAFENAESRKTRVILLTAVAEDEQLLAAIRLGVQGIVLKEMASSLLIDAVREVHRGAQWLEKGLGGRSLKRLLERAAQAGVDARRLLTARELDVVKLVAQGLRNRAISERLGLTEGTVKMYLHNAYEKLGLTNRVELMVYARENALL